MGDLRLIQETEQQIMRQYKAKLSALPVSWIEKIFGHMSAYYGSLFIDRWKDCDIAEVKRIWSEALASFTDHPECFKFALKAMIEECRLPPTLPEFVTICRKHYVSPKATNYALQYLKHNASGDFAPVSQEEGLRRIAELKARFPGMRRVLEEVGTDRGHDA